MADSRSPLNPTPLHLEGSLPRMEPSIANLVRDDEATMNTVVTHAVFKALLSVMEDFKKDQDLPNTSSEQLEQALREYYREMCETIRDELADNPIDADAAVNAAMITRIQTLLRTIDKAAINDLDRQRLSRAISNDQIEEENIVIEQYQVVALVWFAIHHNEAYQHHYPDTLKGKALRDAKEQDQATRVKIFLLTLNEVAAGICHTGIRNALVRACLDQNYAMSLSDGTVKVITIPHHINVEILERVRSELQTRFFEQYRHADAEHKKILYQAFIKSYETGCATDMASLLIEPSTPSLTQHITQTLQKQYLEEYGVDLKSITPDLLQRIQDAIDNTYVPNKPQIYQTCDQALSCSFLLEIDLRSKVFSEAHKKALETFKQWIAEKDLLACDDPKQFNEGSSLIKLTVLSFLLTHRTAIQLRRQQNDLILLDRLTSEGYESEIKKCDDYFSTFQIDSIHILNPERMAALHQQLALCEQLKVQHIWQKQAENFFALWHSGDHDGLHHQPGSPMLKGYQKLYQLLQNQHFQEAIKQRAQNTCDDLSEQERHASQEEPKNIDMTNMNCLLLTALVTHPSEWDQIHPRFVRDYQSILNWINSPQTLASDQLVQNTAYPQAFRAQLQYLLDCYQHTVNATHPAPRYITETIPPTLQQLSRMAPDEHAALLWITRIAFLYEDHLIEEAYLAIKDHLSPALLAYMHKAYDPRTQHADAESKLHRIQERLKTLLHAIPKNERGSFIETALEREKIDPSASGDSYLSICLENIPEHDWEHFLTHEHNLSLIKNMFMTTDDLFPKIHALLLCTQAQREAIITAYLSTIPKTTITLRDYIHCMDTLNQFFEIKDFMPSSCSIHDYIQKHIMETGYLAPPVTNLIELWEMCSTFMPVNSNVLDVYCNVDTITSLIDQMTDETIQQMLRSITARIKKEGRGSVLFAIESLTQEDTSRAHTQLLKRAHTQLLKNAIKAICELDHRMQPAHRLEHIQKLINHFFDKLGTEKLSQYIDHNNLLSIVQTLPDDDPANRVTFLMKYVPKDCLVQLNEKQKDALMQSLPEAQRETIRFMLSSPGSTHH